MAKEKFRELWEREKKEFYFKLIARTIKGTSLDTLAKELNMSKSALSFHLNKIFKKMGVSNKQELLYQMFVKSIIKLTGNDKEKRNATIYDALQQCIPTK